jgi:hypothetical protein
MTEDTAERLRRIEAKLDQCIVMNNENHILCSRILKELGDIRDAVPGEEGPAAARDAAVARIRREKDAVMAAIAALTSRAEALRNRASADGAADRPSADLASAESELAVLRDRLNELIGEQQEMLRG